MNHARFSTIAHRSHTFCSPMSDARAQRLIELLTLSKKSTMVDVGCGKAAFLLQAMAETGAHGTGIDPNEAFLTSAETHAQQLQLQDRLELRRANAAETDLPPASFDVAICIGSSHAFGTYRDALAALARLTRPGGHILIADPYWRKEPDDAYLSFLGAQRSSHMTHAENEAAGSAEGLVPLYSCVSSADEWDHYEGLFCRSVELFVHEQPSNPDANAFRARIRAWREAYRTWGRETLGFGFYLFLKP